MASTAELIGSLDEYVNIVGWINDALGEQETEEQTADLSLLDQHITKLVAALDMACEDTSSQLERIIDDVSRGIPRLTYDLHFIKDSASSLQNALGKVQDKSAKSIPHSTGLALEHIASLDTIKNHMEAAREVLREAESWNSLELEVISLLGEQNYAKAAERLSEASRSMVVFQNTPDYEPRRTLMITLQNQLEASLSSALVAAINSQDVMVCKNYFSIFSNIQRESEFRNYYNGSRRASIVTLWQTAPLSDLDTPAESPAQTFITFLPTFYSEFLALLNLERTSIPAIFPDPPLTLSTLITSTLSSLQPTFSQRLSSLFTHYGPSALKELITAYKATEEFYLAAEQIMEKIKLSAVLSSPSTDPPQSSDALLPPSQPSHNRRRSARMSMSLRAGPNRATSSGLGAAKLGTADGLEWDHELFQPFIDFQVDYESLEKRLLEDVLHEIITSDTKERVPESDRARLLRERAVDVVGAAEASMVRCMSLTHGYGAVGLVKALDGLFQSFIDMWTADITTQSSSLTSLSQSASGEDLSDLDYTSQDWSDFQLSLHLLASARAVFDRMTGFEAKLRSNLSQVALKFRLAHADPANFSITESTRGEGQLLEQSTLNSLELHNLLERVDPEPAHLSATPTLRHTQSSSNTSPAPLLVDARNAVFTFSKACQGSLQGTILAPLRKHLSTYASSPLWTASGDPKSKRPVTANELRVPTFSLSPSDTVQRVAEGLLNLPRVFEVYADDDALSFSLHTLPNIDPELLKHALEPPAAIGADAPLQNHIRRPSITAKPSVADPEAVASAWLSSLGRSLLQHLTSTVLPNISTLSVAGAAQLSSDLGYLVNIVRALNVEFEDLERWKECVDLEDEEGRKRMAEREGADIVLRSVARMRGWSS